ncbi:MAG: hypothetical protein ACTHMJ_01735 [Thermomicrobiales bacterium]
MDVAQTWDELRTMGVSGTSDHLPRMSRSVSIDGYGACLSRIIAREGDDTAANLYWRAKTWPSASHLRAALPAEMQPVAA